MKHGFGKPGVEVKITGIPSALLRRKKETKLQYEARQSDLAARLDDARKRAGFRKGCEKTLELVLKDYEGHLGDVLDIERVERQFSNGVVSVSSLP